MQGMKTAIYVFAYSSLLLTTFLIGIAWWIRQTAPDKRYTRAFQELLAVIIAWTLFNAGAIGLPQFSLQVGSLYLKLGVSILLPYAWLNFVNEYTYSTDEMFQNLVQVSFWLSFGFAALILTNPVHGIYFGELAPELVRGFELPVYTKKPIFWIGYGYAFVATFAGIAKLVWFSLSTKQWHRFKLWVFTGSIFIPMVFQLISEGILPIDTATIDITPAGFALWTIVLVYLFFEQDLFTIAPIARQQVIETLDDPVIIIDRDQYVVDWNEAAEVLLEADPGKQPLAAVAPESLSALIATDQPPTHPSEGEPTNQTAGETIGENPEIELGESERTYNVLTSNIHNRVGELRGQAIVLRDISRLVRQRKKLQEKNERLDKFASVISHDLRNPITVARGYTEMLDDEGSVEEIENSLDRMEAIIDDVLTITRKGGELEESDLQQVRIKAVAEDAWEVVDTKDGELHIETELPVVDADPDQLQTLFENLFRNTYDHCDPETDVYLGRLDRKTGFYVTDDGPGISDEIHEQIFDAGVTDTRDGTGLGLDIVRDVVETHGWEISLDADADRGAKFDVVIQNPSR